MNILGNLPVASFLNYPEFPDSCIFLEFIGFEYILKMLIHCSYIYAKQFRHPFLIEPKGSLIENDFNAYISFG